MPLAQLSANGQPITLWYDIYGLEATEVEFEPQRDSERGETNSVETSSSSLFGTGANCSCFPKAKPGSTEAVLETGNQAEVSQARQFGSQRLSNLEAGAAEVDAKPDISKTVSALGQKEAKIPAAPGSHAHGPLKASMDSRSELLAGSTAFSSQGQNSPVGSKAGQLWQEENPRPESPATSASGDNVRDGGSAATSTGQDMAPACNRVLFIAGLGARGRSEFFQHVVEHMASLMGPLGKPLLSVCTFDNRGIGRSTIPKKKRKYTTRAMAYDTLALLDHLGWQKVHIVGLSLGGFIACKIAAMQPGRVASLMLIGTTPSGWHMLAGISTRPVMATLAGSGPLRWRIPANLRYNFSDGYLEERVEGNRTRMQVLMDNTFVAIEEKNTEKFLAEGQPTIGREGHLAAVFKHRMMEVELDVIRNSKIPCVVLVGRHDRLARAHYVSRLARQLQCTYVVVEAAHAGIMIEAIDTVIPLLESLILGNAQTSASHVRQLGLLTNEIVLRNQLYAREFASSFAPGRVSFQSAKTDSSSAVSAALRRSKSAA